MSDYIKLTEAPKLVWNAPHCSACEVDLKCEDGWICPACGTSWSIDGTDGDKGELYESWSGELLEGEPISADVAWRVSRMAERAEREAWIAKHIALAPVSPVTERVPVALRGMSQ